MSSANMNPSERIYARRARRIQSSEIRELLKLLDDPKIVSFAGGVPDPASFPVAAFAEASKAVLEDPVAGPLSMQYSISEGYLPLRAWIAAHMAARGVACSVDNILITSGSQQALDILAKLFVNPGDTIWVTRPTYLGALQSFNAYEARYATLPISGDAAAGPDIDPLTNLEPDLNPVPDRDPGGDRDAQSCGRRIAFGYLVPDFANPTGETVDEDTRRRIIDITAGSGIPLIEDAAYEALRFDGPATSSCLALDVERCGSIDRALVAYCGTFSKVMSPGLRVGWICASSQLIQRCVFVKQAADLHCPTFNQMIMSRLVTGHYEPQVATVVAAYRQRRDAMLAALARYMPSDVHWTRPAGGMFVWLTLPEGLDAGPLLAQALRDEGIAFVPGAPFHADGGGRNSLRLSYSLQDVTTIDDGMRRLARVIMRALARPAVSSFE